MRCHQKPVSFQSGAHGRHRCREYFHEAPRAMVVVSVKVTACDIRPAADVVTAPSLSVAFAVKVNECTPRLAMLVQSKE
jgi:hypothetical protein